MINPYYEDKFCTIYHGDCKTIIPQLFDIDIVLSDPPYGINFSGFRNKRKSKFDDASLPIEQINLAIDKAKRAAYFFCDWRKLSELPTPTSLIVWSKQVCSMGDLKHEHARSWEGCCFYPQKEHQFIKRPPDVFNCKTTNNMFHPTEKPVPLLEEILKANVGEIVLDPFMGSGSTLIAARNQGRKSIGIEIKKQYCDIAIQRLAQQSLFVY